MTDYFSLFNLPRRPLIDLAKLSDAFARRSAENHATRREEAVLLNEAFRILSDTVSRLEHLLALEPVDLRDRAISPAVEQWFGKVAEILHRFDEVHYQFTQESLHLLRAAKLQLLQEDLAVVEECSAGLASLRESLEQELREIDEGWPNNRAEALLRLGQLALDLKFVEKWANELKERKLRFEELR
ncbi:MAG TPA: hypothetical protein VFO40_24705 [Chthoniobacterales bacterium]|nr:hypothetical protein [Chthoniobacterales bacterium]